MAFEHAYDASMTQPSPAAIRLPQDVESWLISRAYRLHSGSFRDALIKVLREAKRADDRERIDAARTGLPEELWAGIEAEARRRPSDPDARRRR